MTYREALEKIAGADKWGMHPDYAFDELVRIACEALDSDYQEPDDAIIVLAETVDMYTKIHSKCWTATPDECKELMTMEFPMVQTTQMQGIIRSIGEMAHDSARAVIQLKQYAKENQGPPPTDWTPGGK